MNSSVHLLYADVEVWKPKWVALYVYISYMPWFVIIQFISSQIASKKKKKKQLSDLFNQFISNRTCLN